MLLKLWVYLCRVTNDCLILISPACDIRLSSLFPLSVALLRPHFLWEYTLYTYVLNYFVLFNIDI